MNSLAAMLWLLCLQAVLGACDTIYFHEWRARLPALQRAARQELVLHSARDQIYALLLLTLPWLTWQGKWTWVLVIFLALEIVITMWDFVVENWIHKPLGEVYPAERILYGVLGVLYGLFLAALFPLLKVWSAAGTKFATEAMKGPQGLKWSLTVMGILA